MNNLQKNFLQFCLCLTIGMICSCGQTENHTGLEKPSDLQFLDTNKDEILNPFEVLDALLLLQKENKNALTIQSFSTIVEQIEKEEEEEIAELFQELDRNKDGTVQIKEIEGEMLAFANIMDTNADGIINQKEMNAFNFEDVLLASEEEIEMQIEEIFEVYHADQVIELSSIPEDKRNRYLEWDTNRDNKLTKQEAYDFMKADNTPAKFTVKGNTAFMAGVITSTLPATVLQLLFEHPEVTTIEMTVVPGSIDDVANLRAAHYIHKYGLTTKVNSNSSIASGGTDFFLAGKNRIVEDGAKIGVHSWGGGPIPATEVPKDDPVHQKYLDFYNTIGIPETFYWYTLNAAPANDIHIMTDAEITQYKITTN